MECKRWREVLIIVNSGAIPRNFCECVLGSEMTITATIPNFVFGRGADFRCRCVVITVASRKRSFASKRPNLRIEGPECETMPPFANAAIAHAEILCSCGSIFSATRRFARKRSLKAAHTVRFQTVHSLQSIPTIETRTKHTFGWFDPMTASCQ